MVNKRINCNNIGLVKIVNNKINFRMHNLKTYSFVNVAIKVGLLKILILKSDLFRNIN